MLLIRQYLYIFSGTILIEAEIHLKALTLFGNITRAEKQSRMAYSREAASHKKKQSHSWFIEIKKKLCLKNCYEYLHTPLSKFARKTMTSKKIKEYWTNKINNSVSNYKSLEFLTEGINIGKVHPMLTTTYTNARDICRQLYHPVLKLQLGRILQSKRAAFNSYKVDPTCRLCNQEEEIVTHFLITCNALQNARKALLEDITHRFRELLDSININIDISIARVIANPYQLLQHANNLQYNDACKSIISNIEPACRALIYALHMRRYERLGLNQRPVRRTNLK